MKRAGSVPTFTGRKHRVVGPIEDNDHNEGPGHSVVQEISITPDHQIPPPLTISLGSGSSSDESEDDASSYSNDARVSQSSRSVLDDYEVFPSVLGTGAYGEVRGCVHRDTRRDYACKTIYKSRIRNIDHLRREVDLLSEMDHPNIIRMVGCYEDDERVHIVTEKYSGGELFDTIVRNATDGGCLDERTASRIVWSLLRAVEYLHENDIVHRDIKPENILLESDRVDADIRLIDFGLSKRHAEEEPPMTNPVGTAYYMSPELLKGRYDRSTDLWSIGIVSYILLCGYSPFSGDTDEDIFDSIRRGHIEYHARAWSDKSDEARDFIRCLLRRDPRKRYTAKQALMHPWVAKLGKRRRYAKCLYL
jgi:serine/threonine protein kinase